MYLLLLGKGGTKWFVEVVTGVNYALCHTYIILELLLFAFSDMKVAFILTYFSECSDTRNIYLLNILLNIIMQMCLKINHGCLTSVNTILLTLT